VLQGQKQKNVGYFILKKQAIFKKQMKFLFWRVHQWPLNFLLEKKARKKSSLQINPDFSPLYQINKSSGIISTKSQPPHRVNCVRCWEGGTGREIGRLFFKNAAHCVQFA